MTDEPAHRRGRPVSEASRTAALEAAAALLNGAGWPGFSIDEVARRSHVSKATIYRHWSGALALAIEAFGRVATTEVPTRSTGDPARDLQDQVVRLGRFYASREGGIVAQLLGAAVADPAGAELVRDRFFAPRRRTTVELIVDAQASGDLRRDLDPDLIVDMLFGPIVFRLVNGLTPLTGAENAAMAGVTLSALVTATKR